MREQKTELAVLMPLVLETLNAGHEVTFSPRGSSMLPMFREGRDTVTLSRPQGKLKKYDIPLYRRENGQFVLHRVVRVGDTYTCMGDNQFAPEHGIADGQIIAVCTSFTRKGKTYSADALLWRVYAVFWHHSRFPRRVWRAIVRRAAALFRKG